MRVAPQRTVSVESLTSLEGTASVSLLRQPRGATARPHA